MELLGIKPTELIGPLNEVEKKNAPDMLYVQGNTTFLESGARVSIVGSRKASQNGLKRAAKLAHLLVKRNVVVVSGLAEGIDTSAHKTAIQQGGRTIAVLGTPLNKTYPKANEKLQHQIMHEHLAISQYPEGYPTQRKNFPLRNRTMALISDATVIIEASDKSGSLHQGWEALRLGRQLYITKTIVDNSNLKWPRSMMEYGAKVLSDETVEDFFDLLPTRSPALQYDRLPF